MSNPKWDDDSLNKLIADMGSGDISIDNSVKEFIKDQINQGKMGKRNRSVCSECGVKVPRVAKTKLCTKCFIDVFEL